MIEILLRLARGETGRYVFFGLLTVVVNMASYKLLDLFLDSIVANTLAFFIAVLFAYWTNSTFVFRAVHTWKNFSGFIGMRIGTLVIDDGGMWLLLQSGVNDMIAKIMVNAVIIVINYLASKLVIFKKPQ